MKKRTTKKKHSRFTAIAFKRHKLGDLARPLTQQEVKQYARLTKKLAKAMRGW